MHLARCRGLPAFGPDIDRAEAEAEVLRANHARAVTARSQFYASARSDLGVTNEMAIRSR